MQSQNPSRPNVIIAICDDLAFGDLAVHGNPFVRTPHLDILHSQSARFERYYSGPLCTPARVSLMTGRYPYRTRAIDTYLGRSMMDPGETTLAELFRAAGYRTGIFGKWHLGDNYPMRPQDKGFEETLVHRGGGLRQPGNTGDDGYFNPELLLGGKLERVSGYCTDIFTDAASNFIEHHRADPFFVYLAFNAPHSPFEIGDEWVAPHRAQQLPETFARVYGMVDNIDANIGKLTATLERLGLAQNTILIFTSDHGPCPSANVNGKIRFNAGLRGQKSEGYDGGLRVPHFWRLPERIPAGKKIAVPANPIDILPTLCALTGIPKPEAPKIDGLDLSSYLIGDEIPAPDRFLFFQWHRGDTPVRFRNFAVVGSRYKLLRSREDADDELYDLVGDPGESNNLATEHREITKEMLDAYAHWFDDVSSTRPDNYAPPHIKIGTEFEPETILTRQDWRMGGAPDGWQDTNAGFWEIEICRAGTYELRLDLPNFDHRGVSHLRISGCVAQRPVSPGETSVILEPLDLPAGPARLEAWFESGREIRGMRFVRVRRASS